MLKYIGCLIIITAMAVIGKIISNSVGNRIEELKYNLDKLKKCVSDYEVFGMNINCTPEKYKYLNREDIKLFDSAHQIRDIDTLNELISKTQEHYSSVKEKNQWLQKNGVALCILTGIAIITLLY